MFLKNMQPIVKKSSYIKIIKLILKHYDIILILVNLEAL